MVPAEAPQFYDNNLSIEYLPDLRFKSTPSNKTAMLLLSTHDGVGNEA